MYPEGLYITCLVCLNGGIFLACEAKLAIVIAGDFSGSEENADPGLLLKYLPEELAECCHFVEWSTQPSSHYSMQMVIEMTEMLEKLVLVDQYAGVIVISGSGTMEEMTYLTDLLWQHDEPVIYANLMIQGRGGQEEGLMNLGCSVRAALSQDARGIGVMLCSSGELFAASEVTMVAPTDPENTFQSPEKGSLGKILNDEVVFYRTPRRPEFLAHKPRRAAAVETVWCTMGGGERLLASICRNEELEGLVLAGFGTGSIPPSWIPHVRNILRRRVPVALVSRCFQGQVMESNYFEGSFAKAVEMGIISGGKLNPYQARIRMSLGIAAGLTENGLCLYMLNKSVSEESSLIYK